MLRIGLLLPESGDGATIGKPLIAAAIEARDGINAAGGVLGSKIQLVGTFDEGTTRVDGERRHRHLIEQDVDAVVGPASSTIALATRARS